MIISEDGSVTGSIDNSRLDEVQPKSDEAKAQLEQLKRERDAAQAGADADAERLAEVHKAQSIEGQAAARDEVNTPADASGDPNKAAEKDAAAKAEADKAQAQAPKSASRSTDKG